MATNFIFAANWKMYKTPEEARKYFETFLPLWSNIQSEAELVFFPSAFCADATNQAIGEKLKVGWGAQNCYITGEGAFTGENSAQTVKTMGGKYVLLGHSERRHIFGETDDLIATKLAYVQEKGLIPMLCIGEKLEQREKGETALVVEQQLRRGLMKALPGAPLVVAYEPVWAIGTGRVATPAQVQDTHGVIRRILDTMKLDQIAILYGGSVKPDNAKELLMQKHVHGFLVGGASLEVESFLKICRIS